MTLELEAHVFPLLENQAKLFQVLGEYTWQVHLDSGTMLFRDKSSGRELVRCPVQIFGSRAEPGPTWLWAWANPDRGVPADLLRGVERVRDFARKDQKLLFLRDEKFFLPYKNFDIELALVCAGYLEHFTYYACPYENSVLYTGLQSCPEAAKLPRDALMVQRVLTAGTSQLHFDHQRAVLAYLGKPLQLPAEVYRWNIGNQQLALRFDAQGKIHDIDISPRGKG